jgi:co-chaperonin GroES (HSP10)
MVGTLRRVASKPHHFFITDHSIEMETNEVKVIATPGRVIVEQFEEKDVNELGLIIIWDERNKEPWRHGRIVSIGKCKEPSIQALKPGDIVLYKHFNAAPFNAPDGRELHTIKEDAIEFVQNEDESENETSA